MKKQILLLAACLSGMALELSASTNCYHYLRKTLDLGASELLYTFDRFNLADWSIRRNYPKWSVAGDELVGGDPDAPTHGQIFYKTPILGDVVLEFDARIVPPSYHDLVWFWNTRFDAEPWSDGYLGSLAGWWSNMNGIERLPRYSPSAIAPTYPLEPGKTYHIVSGSSGSDHFIFINGELAAYMYDDATPDASKPGYFGFGIYRSMAAYSHLKVYRPHVTSSNRQYLPASQMPPPIGFSTYLVVDLTTFTIRGSSEGPKPSDKTCRTTELWLRRVEPGAFAVDAASVTENFKRVVGELKKKNATLPPATPPGHNGICAETKAFYMGVFPVTQRQWELVMGNNPAEFKGEDQPVERVSYNDIRGANKGAQWPMSAEVDAESFMGRLRAKTGLGFDLPTGSQWELACRAGTTSVYNDGTDGPDIQALARYTATTNDLKGTSITHAPVGLYKPNALGIYDCHGNVWETTRDWYSLDSRTAATNWPGPAKSPCNMRVRRGGSWAFGSNRCRSDSVGGDEPHTSYNDLGFRVGCFF